MEVAVGLEVSSAEDRPPAPRRGSPLASPRSAAGEPALGRDPGGARLDHQPGLVARAKLLVGCGRDAGAAVGEEVDEALGGEPAQRLADRRPRDAELLSRGPPGEVASRARSRRRRSARAAPRRPGRRRSGPETGLSAMGREHRDFEALPPRLPSFVSIRMFSRSDSTAPRHRIHYAHAGDRSASDRPRRRSRAGASFGAWRDVDVSLALDPLRRGDRRRRRRRAIAPRRVASSPTTPSSPLERDRRPAADRRPRPRGRVRLRRRAPSGQRAGRSGSRRCVELALAPPRRSTADLPILGVCRGMQLLNMVAGRRHRPAPRRPGRIHRGEPGDFVSHSRRGRRRSSRLDGDPRPGRRRRPLAPPPGPRPRSAAGLSAQRACRPTAWSRPSSETGRELLPRGALAPRGGPRGRRPRASTTRWSQAPRPSGAEGAGVRRARILRDGAARDAVVAGERARARRRHPRSSSASRMGSLPSSPARSSPPT